MVSLCVLSDQKVLTLIVISIKLPADNLARNFNYKALLSHHNLCVIASQMHLASKMQLALIRCVWLFGKKEIYLIRNTLVVNNSRCG